MSSEVLKGKRLVIAEDQALVMTLTIHTAKQLGMEVIGTASDGQQAVEVILQKRPDIVFMDGRMPKLTGIEATRKILKEYPVCVVMLTAFRALEEEAYEAGVSGFIVQPVTVTKLQQGVTTALERFAARQSGGGDGATAAAALPG
jgi:response regulator NasT